MRVFGYRIFLVRSSYVGFYVLWLARGDDGQSHDNVQYLRGLFRVSGSGDVDGRGLGRCGGRQGVVGGRGRSTWAGHGPVQDESGWCSLPMKMGGRVLPASRLMSRGHRGLWLGLDGFCCLRSQKSTAATQLVAR